MLNIGEHQFLVLLLVVDAQHDASRCVVIYPAGEESLHRLVYMVTFRQGCLLPPGAWFLRER
jgi:hypothetical protein